MNYQDLLKQLDTHSQRNSGYFCNKRDKQNDMSEILYFSHEEYKPGNYLTQETDDYTWFYDETVVDDYKNISMKVKTHIDIDEYDLSQKHNDILRCIAKIFQKQNDDKIDVVREYKKLLKEFDTFRLYKKYNYRRLFKKDALRKSLINRENTKELKQFLADYFNINIIIMTNEDLEFYCKDRVFEMYRQTVVFYEHKNEYQYLTNDSHGYFGSDSDMTLRLKKYIWLKNITLKSQTKAVKPKQQPKQQPKIQMKVDEKPNLSKMKVAELRKLCEKYNIDTKKQNEKGKRVNKLKKELIAELEKMH